MGAFFQSAFSAAGASLNLFLVTSTDGLHFVLMPANYTPTSGHVVRDPSIVKIGATWWVAHTNISFTASTSFDIAMSIDGVNFTYVTSVDCSSVTGNTASSFAWAPEWFVDIDGSVHVLAALNSAVTPNFSIYEMHPTSSDFTSWSTPVMLTSVGGGSVQANIIDPFMVRVGTTYNLWFKASDQTIQYASSQSLTSGYTVLTSGNWAGFAYPDPADQFKTRKEGECLYQLPDGRWMILLDQDGVHMFYSIGDANWTPSSWTQPVLLPPIRNGQFIPQHGTVIPVSGYP